MIKELFHLVYFKLKTQFYLNVDFSLQSIVKNAASIFIYSLFIFGFYKITQLIIHNVVVEYRLGLFLLHRFLGFGLFIFFLAVSAGNILVSFSTLYKSPEVNYLLSKPIRFENIFILKFFDNFFYSSSTLFVFLLASLAGYANYFELSIWFYFWSFFVVVIPYVLMAALTGVLTLFAFVKIASVLGVRITVGIFSAFYILATVIFFNVASPKALIEAIIPYYPNLNIDFSFLQAKWISYLPNFLLSDSMFAYIRFDSVKVIYNSLLLFLGMSGLFVFSIIVAQKFYYKSYLKVLDLRFSNKGLISGSKFLKFGSNSIFPPQIAELLKKEFWLFIREPSQIIHLLVMFFLLILFLSSIGSTQRMILKGASPELQTIIYMSILFFILFMITALSLRFVFPLFSLEGETYWRIRSAPIEAKTLVLIKFIPVAMAALAAGYFLMHYSHRWLPGELFIQSIYLLFFSVFTLLPAVFAMGTLYVNFKEKNPIRISSSQGATVTFMFCLIYLTLVVAIMYMPLLNFFSSRFYGRIPNFEQTMTTVNIILGSIALIVSILSYKLSVKQFKMDL